MKSVMNGMFVYFLIVILLMNQGKFVTFLNVINWTVSILNRLNAEIFDTYEWPSYMSIGCTQVLKIYNLVFK